MGFCQISEASMLHHSPDPRAGPEVTKDWERYPVKPQPKEKLELKNDWASLS